MSRISCCLILIVGGVCLSPGCASRARVTTRLPMEDVREAVHDALESAGYREIEDLGDGSTVAKRSGAAMQPFGMKATIDYLPEDSGTIAVEIVVGGFSIVPVGDWADALRIQVKNQVGVLERRRSEPDSPPVVARQSPPAKLPPFTEQRHALIVGVSEYQDSNFRTLARAKKDARALAEFLESDEGGNISSDRIHLLIDEDATRVNIISTLRKLGRETYPGDMIILYFACHAKAPSGQQGSARYLVPFDSDISEPEATALAKNDVAKWLDEAEAKRQVVFLDCCFGGVAKGVETRADIEDDAFGSLQAPSRVVLTSTKGSQTALDAENDTASNSPFATALLEALKGKPGIDRDENGRLTVKELYEVLRQDVIESAGRAGHEMTPQLYGDAAADLELLRVKK